jgi:hypothetical protein
MGHRLDNFQEFVLTFQSPWNLGAEATHNWSQSFYVSGTITHDDAAAEAAGLALAAPALALAHSDTSLIGITYYPSGSLISTVQKTYTPGAQPAGGHGYLGGVGTWQQLEVAAVMHCPIGKNIRGKEIYLRKYFHAVQADQANPNALAPTIAHDLLFGVFNTGAGPHAVVPVSPTSGAAGGPWSLESHLFTHQLRKGKKKKKTSSGSLIGDLIDAGLDAASAAALAAKLAGKVIASGGE